ncbi:MAG: hypothetical protein HDR27_09685 [Lachnospiraceae bacterium]|nr:hypothetical protein [Lachnospiraceae bacterium]
MVMEEKRVPRILKRGKGKNEGEEIDAEKLLKDKHERTFQDSDVKKICVIDIQTTYNDYKKLHNDLYELANEWEQEIVCFSEETDILSMVKGRALRKVCKEQGILEEGPLLNILEICDVFLCFFSIFQNIYLFFSKGEYDISMKMLFLILCWLLFFAILIPIMLLTRKNNRKMLKKLDESDEDKLMDIYKRLGQYGSLLEDEKVFFVENFSKLDKNCRCYIISYLPQIKDRTQLWCIFDYLFENCKKINVIKDDIRKGNGTFEDFKLVPLKYEEKEEIYKEFNLQKSIDKEYLNCIGADILWENKCGDITGGMKFHSLDFIKRKIEDTRNELDADGRLTKFLYCLVYMSSKYKYSFSINQIISLIQNKETVNERLYQMICDAGKRILNDNVKSAEEIRSYFSKIIEILDGYYFTQYTREGGRKVKKFKFSYDILECFQEKMNALYPDEETVKRWILVKLIGNADMFRIDRYFFDCSNLLVTSNFLEDSEFGILASHLLRMMNVNNCWGYYGPILRKIRDMDADIKNQYLQMETVKKAAVHNMFYVCDEQSMEYGIYFLAGSEDGNFGPKDFSFDSCSPWLPEMQKCSDELADFFLLLYQIFRTIVFRSLEFGEEYQGVEIHPFAGQEYLHNVICELFGFSMICLAGINDKWVFPEYKQRITEMLKQIRTCEEGKAFAAITEEMLLWVESELYDKEDKEYKNVNAGMLIESSNSNTLYFIYGLLNMALVKDKEMVYKNKNTLLNFVSQSIFYFKIVAQGEGITRYVNDLIQGSQSDDLKVNIALRLLVRQIPCKEILQKFIADKIDRVEALVRGKLASLGTERETEEFISSLLLYNANMGNEEFAERIFGYICQYVSEAADFENGSKINKYLRVILDGECQDEECADIVDEINQIDSPSFAIWVLRGYCKLKKEMLERIPQIDHEILTKCSSNIGIILIARYLMGHSYYDCNREILNLYLEDMRYRKFPNEVDIRSYLYIVDNYAKDNKTIKDNEIRTYNNLVSLLLFYMTVELSEEKETGENLPRKTVELLLSVFGSLERSGMQYVKANKIFDSLSGTANNLIRNQLVEEFIVKRFLSSEPIVKTKTGIYLSGDYYFMIGYMYAFPEVYSHLLEKVEHGMEVIKQKHILYLLNLLLENTQDNDLGFNRESIVHVRDILKELYNITF